MRRARVEQEPAGEEKRDEEERNADERATP